MATRWRHEMAISVSLQHGKDCIIAEGLVLCACVLTAPFLVAIIKTIAHIVVNCCLLVFHGSGAPFRLHALLKSQGTAAAAQQPAYAARSIS